MYIYTVSTVANTIPRTNMAHSQPQHARAPHPPSRSHYDHINAPQPSYPHSNAYNHQALTDLHPPFPPNRQCLNQRPMGLPPPLSPPPPPSHHSFTSRQPPNCHRNRQSYGPPPAAPAPNPHSSQSTYYNQYSAHVDPHHAPFPPNRQFDNDQRPMGPSSPLSSSPLSNRHNKCPKR